MEPGGADSAAARAGLTRLADDTPTVEPTANSRPRRLTLPRGNMPSRHGQSSACIFLQLLILSITPLPLYSGYRSEWLRYLREGFGQLVRQIHHDVMPAGQFDDIPSWGSGKFVGEIPERTGVPAIGQDVDAAFHPFAICRRDVEDFRRERMRHPAVVFQARVAKGADELLGHRRFERFVQQRQQRVSVVRYKGIKIDKRPDAIGHPVG